MYTQLNVNKMEHGSQLKNYIETNRVNVKEFANRLGYDRQTIYQMYKRPKFTLDLIYKLKELGVNIVYEETDTSSEFNEPEEKYNSKSDLVIDSLKYVIDSQKEFITQQKNLIIFQNDFIKTIVK